MRLFILALFLMPTVHAGFAKTVVESCLTNNPEYALGNNSKDAEIKPGGFVIYDMGVYVIDGRSVDYIILENFWDDFLWPADCANIYVSVSNDLDYEFVSLQCSDGQYYLQENQKFRYIKIVNAVNEDFELRSIQAINFREIPEFTSFGIIASLAAGALIIKKRRQ